MPPGSVFAEGGGMSGSSPWGKQVLQWMVSHAAPVTAPNPPHPQDGGHPDAIILGAVPLDEPDDRIDALKVAGAGSVVGMVVPEDRPPPEEDIRAFHEARVVFLRGGDQGRYVKGWRGTGIEREIHGVFERGGCVGGSSAGCAILGEVAYSAENSSLSPEEALSDARHHDLTLVRGFLNLVPGVFFDTHFSERGRIARLPVMLAAAWELFDDRRDVLGVGLDTRTACAVAGRETAEILGEGVATALRLTADTRLHSTKGRPPTVTDVSYSQWRAGTTFTLADGAVAHRPDGVQPNPHPELSPESAFEALTLDGANDDDSREGILHVVGVRPLDREDRDEEAPRPTDGAGWRIETGRGRLPSSIVVTNAWSKGVWDRLAWTQRAAASAPGMLAWLLGNGCLVDVDKNGRATVRPESTSSLVVLDFGPITHLGRAEGPGGRPVTHLEGARLHVLGPGWTLDMHSRRALPPARPHESPHQSPHQSP